MQISRSALSCFFALAPIKITRGYIIDTPSCCFFCVYPVTQVQFPTILLPVAEDAQDVEEEVDEVQIECKTAH